MQIVECPRDAMQGIEEFIPTNIKAEYLNLLLQVGFYSLDFGSFVSPKAIPQLRDTAQVLGKLNLGKTKTKLLAIVANQRGAEQACSFEEISYLGYPLSVSNIFQKRNTNKTIKESFPLVEAVQNLCIKKDKKLVVYLSMAFGNPYEEIYSPEIVANFTESLNNIDIRIIAPSDTVGMSTPENIKVLYQLLSKSFTEINFGIHLHSTPNTQEEKLEAALEANCQRFDVALRGFGGCPMAKDELTGNIATEFLIHFLEKKGFALNLDKMSLDRSLEFSKKVFHSTAKAYSN